MVNFIDLYENNREQFNLYVKQFHKDYPELDLFTCEMILRTPVERANQIMKMYETGELKDPERKPSETFIIDSATIHHPDDDEPPKPIQIELISE